MAHTPLRSLNFLCMHRSTKQLLLLGVLAEAAIWLVSYVITDSLHETFRLSARFSGRLSALVFLFTFFQYARSFRAPEQGSVQKYITLFAVLHAIHWGFLATNVYLNEIPLETHKLIVTDDGKTMIDESGQSVRCAMNWANQDAFEQMVADRLCS